MPITTVHTNAQVLIGLSGVTGAGGKIEKLVLMMLVDNGPED